MYACMFYFRQEFSATLHFRAKGSILHAMCLRWRAALARFIDNMTIWFSIALGVLPFFVWSDEYALDFDAVYHH